MKNYRAFSLKRFFLNFCSIFTLFLIGSAIYCWIFAFPKPTKVIVFADANCMAAVMTMRNLQERKIPFEYLDTNISLNDLAFSVALNLTEEKKVKLPFVLVNGTKSENPSIDFIEQQYRLAQAGK